MSHHLDKKFWTDTGWNYVSLGVQAAVGVVLNFVILGVAGEQSLGIFNQIYAVFVIVGQFAVLGLHDSALKYSSEFGGHPEEMRALTLAAATTSVATGLICAGLLALLSAPLGKLFASPMVGDGLLYIAPGLFLFTLNKVLMAILNGQRRMVSFAFGQALRAVTVLGVALWIVWRRLPASVFGYSFTIAEIVVTVTLLLFMKPLVFCSYPLEQLRIWTMRHIRFGSKALIHGFLSESFIRIDIIMLGVFLPDHLVGIYSFAAFFLEGAYQVSIVVRNITNPILVKLLLLRENRSLALYARKAAFLSFTATSLVCIGIVLSYPHLTFWMPEHVITASFPLLLILLGGLAIFSSCVPFDYIFMQAGFPGLQSVYMMVTTGLNVVLNYLLILPYGLRGAAIATATAFVFSCFLLNLFASSRLGLRGGIFNLQCFSPQTVS